MPKKKGQISKLQRYSIFMPDHIHGLLPDLEALGLSGSIRQTLERYHELLQGTRTVRQCRRLEGLD